MRHDVAGKGKRVTPAVSCFSREASAAVYPGSSVTHVGFLFLSTGGFLHYFLRFILQCMIIKKQRILNAAAVEERTGREEKPARLERPAAERGFTLRTGGDVGV